MKVIGLPVVGSTNDEVKKYLSAREDVIVTAVRQTGGRGTKGRSFLSGEGGVYLSALTFYRGLPAAQAFGIMAHAAVAVCRTVEEFGGTPEIKWANDVLVAGRKIAGILIENAFTAENLIDHSVVGIGLNVNNDLSSLRGIAISLSEAVGRHVGTEEARLSLIGNYQAPSAFSDYLSRVRFLGKEIEVREGETGYLATALGILPDGRLAVERCGKTIILSAAEISIRY